MSEIEVFEAADGWRWHLKAANGEIVADSGESYTTRYDAVRAAERTTALMAEEDEGET